MKQYQSVPLKSPSNQERSNTIVTQMESADNFYCRESPLNEQGFRSILSMLEQRQEFQEQEYKIKVNSLEKRIKYLISISSQLTQQNTQLRLQYGDLVKEYEILRNKLQNYEDNSLSKSNQCKVLEEERDKLKQERERLVGLANKYHERSKIRKKRVKELENNKQLLERALNDFEKENLILVQEKQNLLLQYQQQQNSEFVAQQQEKLAQQIIRKTSQVDLTDKNSVQNTIRRFLNDYVTHLNYIYTETTKLINQISIQFDANLDANNSNNYNKITALFESLICKYNEMLESQLKLQFSLNISMPPIQPKSKRNSFNNLNGVVNKSDIVMTSKVIKLQKLNMMLGQFIDSFILYIFRMRTLNYQIVKSESFTQDPLTIFRRIAYLIIATIRMKKKKKSDDFKLLVIEMPIEETMFQLLEIVSTQQQLIERLQE